MDKLKVSLIRRLNFALWEDRYLTFVDLVSVGDNSTLCRLTENLSQSAYRDQSGFDDVAKDTARAYGRELIYVTDENQSSMLRNGPYELMSQ